MNKWKYIYKLSDILSSVIVYMRDVHVTDHFREASYHQSIK